MANNRIQVKRTNVSGRTPNTSNPANTQYIAAGELALNMTDAILFTSNGSSVIEVGANNTSQNISTNNLTVGSALYVVANGNVGIGTSTPAYKLDIASSATSLRVRGAYDSSFIFSNYSLTYSAGGLNGFDNGAGLILSSTHASKSPAFQFVNGGEGINGSSVISVDNVSTMNFVVGSYDTMYLRKGDNRPGSAIFGGLSADKTYNNASLLSRGRWEGAPAAIFAKRNSSTTANIFKVTDETLAIPYFDVTANGEVGIGMTAPTAKLTVANGTSPTSQHLYGTYTDASNYERINLTANSTGHYVLSEEAGTGSPRPLYLGANNSSKILLDTAGRVGIGSTATISGEVALQVVRNNVRWTFNEDTKSLYYQDNIGTTPREGWSIGAPGFGALPFYLKFDRGYVGIGTDGDAGTNSLLFQTQSTTRMTIGASGNVGIGITTPSYKLHVNGDIGIHDAGSLRLLQSGTEVGRLTTNAGELALVGAATSAFLSFYTNVGAGVVERMRIAANGNVGIGNTAPAHKLRVEGTVSIAGNTTPSANLTHDLGSPTLYWNNVYSNNIVTNSAAFSSNVSVGGTLSVTNNVIVNKNLDITSKNVVGLTSLESTVLTTFPVGDYKGGKFTIMAKRGTETHMAEVMVTHNIETAFYNEYSVMYSNTSLFNVSADISGSNVRLLATASTPSDIQFQVMENKFAVDLDTYDRAGTLLLDRSGSVIDERRITREISFGLDFINNSYGLVT